MTQSSRNRLLEMMPAGDADLLRPHLQNVVFKFRMPLYEADTPIEHVYFPLEGVASLVSTMKNGQSAEIGTIGGAGFRLKAGILRDLMERSSASRVLMLHYVHAFFNQVAQSAACNHFHSLERRCCRWLLMTHDRVQSDQFMLTQDFLAMMLGVRRTGVTEAAQKLKEMKLIEYSRGHVTILDRAGLEHHTCECYAVSKHEFDRLLGPAQGLWPQRGLRSVGSVVSDK